MNNIKEAESLSYEFVKRELCQYVMAKYLLSEEDMNKTESFDELTDYSLSKSMQVSPELVKEFDTAKSCDGATSAMAKKVLLFRSIERALDIKLPAMRSARIKTMDDFADMLWDTMRETPKWSMRML